MSCADVCRLRRAPDYALTPPPAIAYHAGMSDMTNRIEALRRRVDEIAVHL